MRLLNRRQVSQRVLIIISSAEFAIMLFLAAIPYAVNTYWEALLDVSLLALISTPLIYVWVINPFVRARDEALAQISHLAFTDALTQLANRRLLSAHLEKIIAASNRRDIYAALLLIDLDGFKLINDGRGHDTGDAVLVVVADRLRAITRSEDFVGRMGGDEFILLISHLDRDEQAAREKLIRITQKLKETVEKPIPINGHTLKISASIGIRLLGKEELSTELAFQQADSAMYRAKQAGKACAVFYDDSNCRAPKTLVNNV